MIENKLLYELQQKYQRDINRCYNSDRNIRKKGLQKLLNDLPWYDNNNNNKDILIELCLNNLFQPLLNILSDSIEKCREYSLQIFKNICNLCLPLNIKESFELLKVLCLRVNEIPYPEQGEELRLQIVELIQLILLQHLNNKEFLQQCSEIILTTMSKGFQDSFPAVKRCWSEIIVTIAPQIPYPIHLHHKILLKGLLPNCGHQHHKVRSLTINALESILLCLCAPITTIQSSMSSEESQLQYVDKTYLNIMSESVLPVLSRGVGDRSTGPRISISKLTSSIICKRIQSQLWFSSNTQLSVGENLNSNTTTPLRNAFTLSQQAAESFAASISNDIPSNIVDTELLSELFILLGDSDETVRKVSVENLDKIFHTWKLKSNENNLESSDNNNNDNIETKQLNESNNDNMKMIIVEEKEVINENFIELYGKFVLDMLCKALSVGWTTDVRLRFLSAINALFVSVEQNCSIETSIQLITNELMPQTFNSLYHLIVDEETEVRKKTEVCIQSIGRICCNDTISNHSYSSFQQTSLSIILNYIIPRIKGEVNGMDTAYHRKCSLLFLHHIVNGMSSKTKELNEIPNYILDSITIISTSISQPSLYEYRDQSLLEAALLLNRSLSLNYYTIYKQSFENQRDIIISLIYLCGRCEFEDSIIQTAAKIELTSFAENVISSNSNNSNNFDKTVIIRDLLGNHFSSVLQKIILSPPLQWTNESPHRAAFEALVKECTRHAWINSSIVLDQIIVPLVQPKPPPEKGSLEEINASYAAIRGDVDDSVGKIDIRLSMLVLLEIMLRNGSLDWECGKYFAQNCEMLLEKALLPNLVWRAGKVEGVIRKVSLTATHGLLKAGGVPPQALFRSAPHLVPLLASDLDDSDVSSRHLGSLCLDIIFERLQGAFGEQAIHDIYPKLLKRLDDSEDTIRVSICKTLKSFLVCAAPECYRGTTIDYTLDQLFVHLDDPDPNIQKPVFEVILTIAENIDSKLVLNKAKNNLQTHRTPVMCEAIIEVIQNSEK